MGNLLPTSSAASAAMALDPDDPAQRREGVRKLSKSRKGQREPYLRVYATLLNTDEDASVRSVAARALGRAGAIKYLPDVINALDDESSSVRWDAAVALDKLIGGSSGAVAPGDTQPAAAVDPLREHAVEDTSADVRSVCVWALRHFRRGEAIATLKICLRDDDFAVRHRARQALTELFGQDHGYHPRDWQVRDDGLPAAAATKATKPWWKLF